MENKNEKKLNRRKIFLLGGLLILGAWLLKRAWQKRAQRKSSSVSYHPAQFYQKL